MYAAELAKTAKGKATGELTELVAALFERLRSCGVSCVLLRGYQELFVPTGYLEIDLLVSPGDLVKLADAVAPLGFVELPAWGHAPHKFFVAFDAQRADWVKLDVVTDLRYGAPMRRFRVDLLQECLQNRVVEGVPQLGPAEELLTLLLHCLLDKGRFKAAHQERLAELWPALQSDSEAFTRAENYARRFLAPALTWEQISAALARGEAEALLQSRTRLERQFLRRQPFASLWRDVSARVVRRLRPVLFALCRRGFAVALLAPDGAGKSTLARALVGDAMLKARQVYMGGNVAARNVGLPTTRWLHQRLKAVNGHASKRNPFYLGLRVVAFGNRLLEQWLRALAAHYHLLRGRIVIFDRYVYDAWLTRKKKTPWKRVRRFLFEALLPEPELVFLLDAPGEVLFRRKGEHSPAWLEQQRQKYLQLRERIPNLRVLDATQPAESVRSQALVLIWQHRKGNGSRS